MAIETESPFRCVWTGTLMSASGSLGRTAVGPVMQCLHFSVEHSTDPQLLFHLESDSMSQAGKETPLLNRPVLERLTPKQAGGEPRGILLRILQSPRRCDQRGHVPGRARTCPGATARGPSPSPTPSPCWEVSKTPQASGPQTPFLLHRRPYIFQENL